MINISEKELEIVKKILNKHFEKEEILIFGSRITEKIKPYSDLDITIKGESPIILRTLDRAKEDFEESELNFTVDLLDYWRIPESFRKIIDNKYEVLSLHN